MGAASAGLGLGGVVSTEALDALLAGVDPMTGEVLRPARSQVRVAAFDLTFSAPKSVSVLFGLAGEEIAREVVMGHSRSVDAVTDYLEREAVRARRTVSGRRREVPTTGTLGAGFLHRTSRAADPHLHTHVVVANLVCDLEGRWSAIDARGVYALARTAGFLYEANLRYELSARLGVRWCRVRNGRGDIDGVPAPVLREFSRRRQEVEAHLARSGRSGPRAARAAALATRPRRDLLTPFEEIRQQWHWRARGLAMNGPDVVEGSGARPRGRNPDWRDRTGSVAAPVEVLVNRAAAGAGPSGFSRAELLRACCELLQEGSPVSRIELLADEVLGSAHVRSRPGFGGRWRSPSGGWMGAGVDCRVWTTREVVAAEERIADAARRARGRNRTVDARVVTDVLARRPELGPDLRGELRRIVGPDGVEVLLSRRRSLTTELLDAARETWEVSGVAVVGAAARDVAVSRLESTTAIESVPLRHLLSGVDGDRSGRAVMPRGGVVVLDEADRVGPLELEQLVRMSEVAGAKLVCVGRPLPVGTGGFEALVRSTRAIELDPADPPPGSVVVTPDRILQEVGGHLSVSLSPTVAAARQAMVRDWLGLRLKGETAVMVALDREEAADLGRRAAAVIAGDQSASVTLVGPDRPRAVTSAQAKRIDAPRLLVLGDAGVVGDGDRGVPSERVTHYVVVGRGIEGERLRSRAMEAASPRYLTDEIGPRPWDGHGRSLWTRTALELDRFRRRWGIGDSHYPFGREDEGVDRRGSPLERSERRKVERTLSVARRQLVPALERQRSVERGISL